MISVVIPVKDGGADLVRCLEAISRQRVDDEVEVVVVDSGSRDGSAARARSLGARVQEIPAHEFNHGRTRNLGARRRAATRSSSRARTHTRPTITGSRG